MSQNMTFHFNVNFNKCHKKLNGTKTKKSPKIKCCQNSNVSLTEMS